MAESSSDAFLNGLGVRVSPRDVETELTRLWGPAAERAGGPDLENPHVTRIVLANLVVVSRDADLPGLEGVLNEVTTRFPCRAIVLRRTNETDRTVDAEVSALCHLPAPGLPQVCSERIELSAGPGAEDLLPGAVRPLLEADLPFVLWWTYDPRESETLFRNLGDECTRLILDLPDPGTDPAALRLGLDPSVTPHGRDAVWFGLARWRELVAQFFDPPCHLDALSRLSAVTIRALSPDPKGVPRLAAWFGAWLAGQLGWQPMGAPKRSAGRVEAQFGSRSGPIALTLVTEHAASLAFPQIREIALTANTDDGAETFHLVRTAPGSPEIQIHTESPSFCALPRLVLAPDLDAAHRVAGGLESSRIDPPFQHALPHLFWLLGGE